MTTTPPAAEANTGRLSRNPWLAAMSGNPKIRVPYQGYKNTNLNGNDHQPLTWKNTGKVVMLVGGIRYINSNNDAIHFHFSTSFQAPVASIFPPVCSQRTCPADIWSPCRPETQGLSKHWQSGSLRNVFVCLEHGHGQQPQERVLLGKLLKDTLWQPPDLGSSKFLLAELKCESRF